MLYYFKGIILILNTFIFFSWHLFGQCSINANATAGITLTYVQAGGTNASGVAYNPNQNLYYAAIAGNAGFPLETFSSTGTPLYQTLTGFDMRGLWWNPNLNQLESNGYSTGGIWRYNLNGSGYALNTGISVFTGMNQPDAQSVGDYNCVDNEIVYYNSGSIQRRSRATNALIATITVTGLPTAVANTNWNTILYTDCTGNEYAIVDYSNKRVYFINKTSGAYTGTSQLPATAVTNNGFRASWANGKLWLYNTTNRTWTSYDVINNGGAPCTPVALPVELIDFSGESAPENTAVLSWATENEHNSNYYLLESSQNGTDWTSLGEVTPNDLHTYSTSWKNQPFGLNYYRLSHINQDGEKQLIGIRTLLFATNGNEFSMYPNPASESVTILGKSTAALTVCIYTMQGAIVSNFELLESNNFDVSTLDAGSYFVSVTNSKTGASEIHKLIIAR